MVSGYEPNPFESAVSKVQDRLVEVAQLAASNGGAFAATLRNGDVVTWGSATDGADRHLSWGGFKVVFWKSCGQHWNLGLVICFFSFGFDLSIKNRHINITWSFLWKGSPFYCVKKVRCDFLKRRTETATIKISTIKTWDFNTEHVPAWTCFFSFGGCSIQT